MFHSFPLSQSYRLFRCPGPSEGAERFRRASAFLPSPSGRRGLSPGRPLESRRPRSSFRAGTVFHRSLEDRVQKTRGGRNRPGGRRERHPASPLSLARRVDGLEVAAFRRVALQAWTGALSCVASDADGRARGARRFVRLSSAPGCVVHASPFERRRGRENAMPAIVDILRKDPEPLP